MPRIFDNIEQSLLPILRDTLKLSDRADFCIGYFNLRGWQKIDDLIEQFVGGDLGCCRLLIGMQKLPQDELSQSLSLTQKPRGIDNSIVTRLKRQIAQEFCQQLMWGVPRHQDELGLQRLRQQILQQKLRVKLFLRHPLHAKLYLIHRTDPNNPTVGFVGSSNLTLSGLQSQGELNVDVLDHDACQKLQNWFEDRWQDRWCIEISDEIANIIHQSWARETPIPPYHIYLKIAYHLSQEARAGLSEYKIPKELENTLFDFQKAAVQIAARHLHRRGGVLVGDVVGLGKTLMATALAKILQDDFFLETLIISPKNLVSMWQNYVDEYRLIAKVISMSQVQQILPEMRRYRVVLIDESHNLRNRAGKRYRVIQDYINMNESYCILLTATPYNKTYLDLSNQLRLFVPEDKDLGIRPEKLLQELGGEIEFRRRHQAPVRSLAAFEKSEYTDDWRELMRLYMVRRTRSFIQTHYTHKDETGRKYLEFADGTRSYFPRRQPQTLTFDLSNPQDPYHLLYSEEVVNLLNTLNLPRYGLGNYIVSEKTVKTKSATPAELGQLKSLSRAGKRLKGFCRTNLFKRLESGGPAFMQSLDRHILRNYIFLHAISENLEIPIGTQDASLLTIDKEDQDFDTVTSTYSEDDSDTAEIPEEETLFLDSNPINILEANYRRRAAQIYQNYTRCRHPFKWIRSQLFKPTLKKDLHSDALALISILQNVGNWHPQTDQKLQTLYQLITQTHPQEKILIFTQFADTVTYLTQQLQQLGITHLAGVTGTSPNPAEIARNFSPRSHSKTIPPEQELRILIATDILSEGLNLQDCAIIVNYDLPWAIIRLIQRAGRVDRIGQMAETILCYSFLPADGVEKIIQLRSRLTARLEENAEVVGTDETFFEEQINQQTLLDLYHEKAQILDGDDDTEVDLTSEAYQIWKNAIDADPSLKKTIENLPHLVYSTRHHEPTPSHPEGVILYMKTAEGNDALAWLDSHGNSVTQSQFAILRAAACHPGTPAIDPHPHHHDLVERGSELIAEEEKSTGGQLGRPSGARFRTYERLKRYVQEVQGTLFATEDLIKSIDQIYRHPLRQSALDRLNRALRSGVTDREFAELVVALYLDDRLCLVHEDGQQQEPQIICSLGLRKS